MSWCGGGEMRPTPAVEWRVFAIHGYTLCPGSCPPSPGFARDAETPRRHLLDRTALGIAVGERHEPLGVLAALAGVRLAAQAVHRDRERLVCLGADRPVRHRPGRETFDDRLDRLDLVDRDGRPGRLQPEQPPQRRPLPALYGYG